MDGCGGTGMVGCGGTAEGAVEGCEVPAGKGREATCSSTANL